jgi:very-short-patch-repair endonuclease
MLWRRQRLIAELDGRAYHEDAFEVDRERQEEREAARFKAMLA